MTTIDAAARLPVATQAGTVTAATVEGLAEVLSPADVRSAVYHAAAEGFVSSPVPAAVQSLVLVERVA